MRERGTLIGVGVGPGDPELLTLKAVAVIRDADVVAYPVNAGGASLAREIAAAAIPEGAEELGFPIPIGPGREHMADAYDAAGNALAERLEAGKTVACLCLGDPLLYGSFIYLMARLTHRFAIDVVPGITAMTACAALARIPLAMRDEVLKIVPATLPQDRIAAELADADAAVIMKVGRHGPRVRDLLGAHGLAANAVLVEHAGRPGAWAGTLSEAGDGPRDYFSTILTRRESRT